MFSKITFGERLLLLRKAAGETQADVASLLSVTPIQISDMENEKTATSLERFVLICEHYHVSADYLLGLK